MQQAPQPAAQQSNSRWRVWLTGPARTLAPPHPLRDTNPWCLVIWNTQFDSHWLQLTTVWQPLAAACISLSKFVVSNLLTRFYMTLRFVFLTDLKILKWVEWVAKWPKIVQWPTAMSQKDKIKQRKAKKKPKTKTNRTEGNNNNNNNNGIHSTNLIYNEDFL